MKADTSCAVGHSGPPSLDDSLRLAADKTATIYARWAEQHDAKGRDKFARRDWRLAGFMKALAEDEGGIREMFCGQLRPLLCDGEPEGSSTLDISASQNPQLS